MYIAVLVFLRHRQSRLVQRKDGGTRSLRWCIVGGRMSSGSGCNGDDGGVGVGGGGGGWRQGGCELRRRLGQRFDFDQVVSWLKSARGQRAAATKRTRCGSDPTDGIQGDGTMRTKGGLYLRPYRRW
jgi:hypothetical protein